MGLLEKTSEWNARRVAWPVIMVYAVMLCKWTGYDRSIAIDVLKNVERVSAGLLHAGNGRFAQLVARQCQACIRVIQAFVFKKAIPGTPCVARAASLVPLREYVLNNQERWRRFASVD